MRESSSSAVCRFLPVFFPTEIYYLPQCPGLVAQVSISRLSVFAPAKERISAFFQTEVTESDTLVRTQKIHAVSTFRLKMNVNSIRCWPFLVLFLVFASSAKSLTRAAPLPPPPRLLVNQSKIQMGCAWSCTQCTNCSLTRTGQMLFANNKLGKCRIILNITKFEYCRFPLLPGLFTNKELLPSSRDWTCGSGRPIPQCFCPKNQSQCILP